MAATVQAGFPTTDIAGGNRSSITKAATIAAGAGNRILVVEAFHEDAASVLTGVTWNGVALTKIDAVAATAWSGVEMWYLKAPATGTFNVVATKAGANQWGIAIYVLENVDQTTSFRTPAKGAADSGTSTSHTVASVAIGDLILDALGIDGTGHAAAVGANQTLDFGPTGFTGGDAQGSRQTTTDGIMSWTWTTSAPNSHLAVAFIGIATGTAYTDSATVALGLIPSSVETAQFVETNTIAFKLTPSSTDVAAYVEANTAQVTLTPATTQEGLTTNDAATAILSLVPSSGDVASFVDASTASVTFSPSGTDQYGATDSGQATLVLTPSGIDVSAYVNAATPVVQLIPSSADIAQYVDGSTASVLLTPSATEVFGGSNSDAATIALGLSPTSSDIAAYIDANTIGLGLQPSSTEQRVSDDNATATVILTPTGADTAQYIEANTARLNYTVSGTEQSAYSEASVVTLLYGVSSTELSAFADATVATVQLTPTSTDTAQFVDTTVLTVGLTPSGTDLYQTPGGTSAGTVYLQLTPYGPDVYLSFVIELRARIVKRWGIEMLKRASAGTFNRMKAAING